MLTARLIKIFFGGIYLESAQRLIISVKKISGVINVNMTRRNFIKLAGTTGLLLSFGRVDAATSEKILVAYFSRTGEEYGIGTISKGNTAIVAEIIAQKVGGNLFEIKPVTPYPNSYEDCKRIASREKATKAQPAFVGDVENFSQYTMIFIGYPIWYGAYPQIVETFLKRYDFGGKKIFPFCTHEGSGLGGSVNYIKKICPKAVISDGLAIYGSQAGQSAAQVERWLKSKI